MFVGYFSMQIPSGMILQLYVCEWIGVLSALLMGICSLSFAIAPNVEIVSTAQFFAGIAQAPMVNSNSIHK